MRIIFHIDVNNAFLAWTSVWRLQNKQSDLRLVPAVIAGSRYNRNSLVLAKSIPAKKLGIKTAMPINQAFKKAPNLITSPPDYHLYSEMSKKLFDLIQSYTPDLEICSIDECFLDYTPVKKLYGDEIIFAEKLQKEIFEKLGFTVNIGIANNKLCAKMASDLEKPNKIITLYQDEVVKKMYPLPIENLYGVGQKTSGMLKKIGIYTIKDLAEYDQKKLEKFFKNKARGLIELAKGIDDSEIVVNRGRNKCISHSQTFDFDVDDETDLLLKLSELTETVAYQLRQQKSKAYVVGIVIKDAFFKTKNHQKKITNATDETMEMKKIVKKLFLAKWSKKPVRMLGVKVEQLVDNDYYQMSLFEDEEKKLQNNKLNQTLDELSQKYGHRVIKK